MSKPNRSRPSDRLGRRMEFSFSDFCAVQVPVVSDRLLITIISVGSGKTIAKSSKAAALNGICEWPDSILQSIRFSRDEVSQEYQEYQCKIVVSMGSTKTAILGEAFLNLTTYLSSSDSTDISLPLKKSNSGTVLQLKIQCLGAKKSSGKSWSELSTHLVDSSPTNGEMGRKSGFYDIVNKHARSLPGNEGACQDESGNRDASFSAPKSRRSSNSGDRKNLSPRDNSNEGLQMGSQDAASSYVNHDSLNRGDDSSKDLRNTAEEIVEKLQGKAKMWERHSRKLKIEMETLKNECTDKSKQQAELLLELSASHSERDSLRREIEELKSSLEDLTARQTIVGTPECADVIFLQKETIDEVQFLKESNANLTTQLNKTQETNIELVSILQELEETIELQRVEMSKLPQASDVVDHDVSKSESTVRDAAEWARILSLKEDEITMLREKLNRMLSIENADGVGPNTIYLEVEKENEFLKVKIQELENDCSELTEENLGLIYKLKEASGMTKGEDPCISSSEEIPTAGRSSSDVEHLERKCADLELNLLNLGSEFSGLEEKFQKSQDELKERTLELSDLREKLLHATELELNLRSVFSGLEEKFQISQDELKETTLELSELREKLLHATELEGADTDTSRHYKLRSGEPDDTETELDVLKRTVLLKEQEIDGLQHCIREMENTISDIQKKCQVEEPDGTETELDVLKRTVLLKEQEIDDLQHRMIEMENTISDIQKKCQLEEPDDTETELDVLKRTVLLKEQEIDGLQHRIREMENTISDIQKERSQLEEPDDTETELDVLKRTVLLKEQEIDGLQHRLREMENTISDIQKERSQLKEPDYTDNELDVLKHAVLLKEQEIDGLQHCVGEMENNISDIQKEKTQLEERLAASLQESSMTSKCLDEAREDMLVLTSSVDSHVSANKVLEAKISELVHTVLLKEQEIDGFHHCKREMENGISDIQKEKSQLEERLAASLEESSMTSKFLDEARENLRVLTSSIDSHVSANEVLEAKISELVHTVLLKEQEIDGFHHCKREMENTISDIQKEKSQLEERLAASLEESIMTSKCLDEAREDLRVLTSSVDSHASANKVLEAKISELVDTIMLKEQDIDGFHHCVREMENTLADIQKEKSQLEERLAVSLEESSMTSKCLDEAREDLLVLTSSVNSHVSANKVLEETISEVERRKVELESHVSKLEYENIELTQFISELEAQLTSLASENESIKLQMDDSISLMTTINDLVEQQQAEIEAAKLELKQKHLDSQRRLSELQEDSDALSRSKEKLQATIDSITEECSSLQTLTVDLKKQKLELHGRCAQLEQELDQSKRKTADLFNTVEFLETKISMLQKDITLKEQSLLSKLENIFQEHKEHEERINRAHFLLNKIENEKIVEVKNLEREIMSLTAELSSTDGERESTAVDNIHEVSILRADKGKLEANLEDINAQMRHYESQLEDLRTESKSKIKDLTDSLNASKQNEETLTTDVEHIRRLMEAARSNEENLRKTSDELELKYKSSDYEKQQVMEEISELKIQVNKMASIQDEVSKLQNSLDQAKFEKKKLEEVLQSLSEECEELKVQKAMLTDKVSCIQSISHEADEETRGKSMQARLVINQGNDDSANDNGGTPVHEDPDIQSKIHLLETRLAEALEQNKLYRAQLQSPTGEGQSGSRDEKDNKDDNRVAQLESELKDMQDRLLNVSMQYAEVEAQREELVMELKNATAKKGRWF
nr:intracellular protein transport protein USO1-like isoform X2 [Lolium perenne]